VSRAAKPRASVFARRLAQRNPTGDRAERRWLYVPYDQLHDGIGPLAREEPGRLGIVLVESPAKAGRRPYHRQKLALVLANQRHFALEQVARGVAVRHVVHEAGFAPALSEAAAELGPLTMMEAAERELRAELAPLVDSGVVKVVPHEGWLTSRETFLASQEHAPPYRMDAFYRAVRREHDVLMERGRPVGGRFSFDAENREPWRGEPPAPEPPVFTPDDVTREVGDLIERHFGGHPGTLDLARLPATHADAEALWDWARRECLPHFGPYEDAMSRQSPGLFHARIAALLNVHRLLPARVVADVEALDLPLPSREGFLRQVWGWREFMRHVHVETDGLRRGYDAARVEGEARDGIPGSPSAAPAFLGEGRPLPPAWWDGGSGLACLDTVVEDVWREGWSHHITRLMVLGNIAMLIDASPRELTDWFWAAYVDAYDWVVEPNVLGMATFATGELLSTKPYISGAAYVNRMGDHCGGCAFDPRRNCPLTSLYWAFLDRHRDRLQHVTRLALPYANLKRRDISQRGAEAALFERVSAILAEGGTLSPQALTEA
jgi:deoxyribodipyrimidine photolyase-related protein